MDFTEWLSVAMDIVANTGFPIFVALYLLHRMESKLDDVVNALKDLSRTIDRSAAVSR
ncbi:YvrJ family protein [Atopococcus tabaci]|uniref:YvrJ family protein n=1 Tax=Atopococcus tabaci TaxID=269774 RepID=UPI00041179D4|nr:YvrJ family protein [Atopococcus tabaci]